MNFPQTITFYGPTGTYHKFTFHFATESDAVTDVLDCAGVEYNHYETDTELTEEQVYHVMQHLDSHVSPLPYINTLAQQCPKELELTIFGMMDTDDNSSTLSDKAEPEYRDIMLAHRPNDGEGNIPLFEFENCTDDAFVSQIVDVLFNWLGVEPEYVDGQ